ncbi:hypothetical protein H4R35_004071 [Dimargaris xerosporica]|nr:hypothetical protein H4R35_004071 [Dimargaris xerosporica]
MVVPPVTCHPVCLDDFEAAARTKLGQSAWDYYATGANDMQTMHDNRLAFSRLRLRPRVLRDASTVSTTTSLLGRSIASPICIAPSAMQRMADPAGEEATAKAAAAFDTGMVLSTYSTTALEQVIHHSNGHNLYWFQLYLYQDRAVSQELIQRAERAGYQALVLTVDTPVIGRRLADARNKFQLPRPWHLANFPKDLQIVTASERAALLANGIGDDAPPIDNKTLSNRTDAGLTWAECIPWLRNVTRLPIILKGILTREDAELAVLHGCNGIIVSNHGGRQLDGVLAAIDALPEVVAAVRGRIEVYMDGGIRKGTDVFKALALGAKAVFLGRPVLWALAYNGEQGVKDMLRILQDELELAMALCGCTTIEAITPQYLQHTPELMARL